MHPPDALTYVVLDVPEPQASAVMAMRQRHADLFRAALPVEITLTDSFDAAQEPGEAFDALDRIAFAAAPLRTRFAGAHRFPNSDTFVLRVGDEEPFRLLRRQIAETGLRFQASPYPFVPHCTLRTRSPVSDEEAQELLATDIRGEMTLDVLSVYTLTRAATPAAVSCQLRHRVRLGAR